MGFKIKGFKKVLRNPTHSKVYKRLYPQAHYVSKIRKKLGLTGKKIKRFLMGNRTSQNSANAVGVVIPSHAGSNRSVTSLY